jgi:catechol 2,3-dioxygenase-like lactoylglutathione lyase family enzyme
MRGELLARPGLDFGLPTDHERARRKFYEALGLSYLQTDHIMDGQDEVYYTLHGSWLKIVTSDKLMSEGVSGYQQLLIADPSVDHVTGLFDPDGLKVSLVPPGHLGIEEVGVVTKVNDVEAQVRFLLDGLEADPVGAGFRVGNTVFFIDKAESLLQPGPMFARGFTMVTLIVRDIFRAHASLIDAGGAHGLRVCEDPMVPGRCLYSFVQDPNGNWIELVQFSELSGPLPKVDRPPPSGEEFLRFRDHGIPV